MKNLFSVLVIATVALASAVAAQDIPQADAAAAVVAAVDAPVAVDAQAGIPSATSPTDDQEALWKKKKHHKHHHHHKHHKHHHKGHKHHKHKHHKGHKHHKDKCCIKYITITSVPECKPEPTKCPPKPLNAAADVFNQVDPAAPIPAPL